MYICPPTLQNVHISPPLPFAFVELSFVAPFSISFRPCSTFAVSVFSVSLASTPDGFAFNRIYRKGLPHKVFFTSGSLTRGSGDRLFVSCWAHCIRLENYRAFIQIFRKSRCNLRWKLFSFILGTYICRCRYLFLNKWICTDLYFYINITI